MASFYQEGREVRGFLAALSSSLLLPLSPPLPKPDGLSLPLPPVFSVAVGSVSSVFLLSLHTPAPHGGGSWS